MTLFVKHMCNRHFGTKLFLTKLLQLTQPNYSCSIILCLLTAEITDTKQKLI